MTRRTAGPGSDRAALGPAILLLCLGALPPAARAGWKPDRFDYGFFLSNRFRLEQNLPDRTVPDGGQTARFLYQGEVVGWAGLDWASAGSVVMVLDSGELSQDTIYDGGLHNERSEDAFFQQGYFESFFLDPYGVAFKVGQQHVVAGDSYVLDDFLLAGQVGLNLDRMLDLPAELYLSAVRVAGSSLYFQLRALHPFSSDEKISLSLGWLHDTEGFFSEIQQEIVALLPKAPPQAASLRSRGEILWATLSLQKAVSSFRFSLVGILNAGSLSMVRRNGRNRLESYRVPALGYLVDVQVGRNLTDRLYVDAFYLMASGEDDMAGSLRWGERLDAFVSIVPFITRTNLFFNGGINDVLSTRAFDTAGSDARGFGVPGVSMSCSFTERISAVWKGAFLFATADPPARAAGRGYGWETDLMGFWDLGRHVRLSVEADLFLPGDFYRRVDRPPPDTAYRIMGGVDLYY